jgi:hypothetical protein
VTGPAIAWNHDGTAAELKRAVGADRIASTLIDFGVQGWVGDNSLSDGSPVNDRMTQERDRILVANGQRPHPRPLCGTVVLLGLDRQTGEQVDLPVEWQWALWMGGRLGWIS